MKNKRKRFSLTTSLDYAKQADYLGQDLLLEEARIPFVSKSIILLALFSIITFLVWSSLSTVNELVRGDGNIEIMTTIHLIKHNKSGTLDSIEVMNGQYVKEGELLYTLVDERKINTEDNSSSDTTIRKEILLVRSPITGIVHDVDYKLIGHKVSASQNIIKIHPLEENPIAIIKIKPQDIDELQQGMGVKVKITTRNGNRYQSIPGLIESISSSIFYAEDGSAYHQARVVLSKNHIGKDQERNLILPGMRVLVDIPISKRSILNYLITPLDTSLSYALTER